MVSICEGDIVEDTIKFKRTYAKRGDSMSVVIPVELGQYLGLEEGDQVILTGYSKGKGKFIAIWKE